MSEDRNFEDEARQEGWKPLEEWKGDPERWVDAETFVKKGEEILPIVNAKNRELKDKVDHLESRVGELLETNKEFKNFTDKQIEKERQEKQQLIEQLEEARAKAVADGDSEQFKRTDKQLNDLRSEQSQPQRNQPDPNVQQSLDTWYQQNQWYGQDSVLTALVDGYSDQVAREQPWLKGKGADFMEACKARAQEAMPDKFENPNRNRQTVEDTQPKKGNGRGRTFDDLPDDAKAAFAQFKRDIPGFTEEDYLKHYDWESE